MKTIKFKKSALIICMAALLFYGCEEFLIHDAYGPLSAETFWQSEEDLMGVLNAFYDYTYREGVTGRGVMWFEACSDDMVTGRTHAVADGVRSFQMAADNALDVRITWEYMYQMIIRANDIFRNVPDMRISEALKTNAIGQAHFFRAYAYLWLAPWYADNGPNGGLPIITEASVTLADLDAPRPASVLENYDMIISDMREAARILPYHSQLDTRDYGRPHKAAAWAFAARAALYASQYDSKYFDIVIEMCDNVINMTGADQRGLFPDFTRLFRMENNFSEEYIYSILGNEKEGPKYHGMGFQNGGFGIHNTWGYWPPTLDLWNAFEPGDIRRDATILFPDQQITFLGNNIHWAVNPPEISPTTGMTVRKFLSVFEAADALGTVVNVSGNNHSNKLGTVVMRYADVLLMKAEALIWKNGEGDAVAIGLLNDIRERAGLPRDSQATKAQLKNERRVELTHEFLPSRHVDLVRWGDAQEVYARPQHGVQTVLNPDGTFNRVETIEVFPARNFNPAVHHVFPIPAEQINKSRAYSGNLVQNRGY